jgi:hypothetical protein
MALGNMREQGVHHLIPVCNNDACRHQAIIDVSSYPAETRFPIEGASIFSCADLLPQGRKPFL